MVFGLMGAWQRGLQHLPSLLFEGSFGYEGDGRESQRRRATP